MSTRSRIAVQLPDGSYCSVYCHFDGDLVGMILQEYYNSDQQAHMIIDYGDLSYITASSCGAYAERGERWADVCPRHSKDLQQLIRLTCETGGQYLYYRENNFWNSLEIEGYSDE